MITSALFRNIRTSFGFKVYISMIAAMIFVAVLTNYIHNVQDSRAFRDEMIRNGLMLAAFTAETARLGIFSEDVRQINNALQPAFNARGVLEVCAWNHKRDHLSRLTHAQGKGSGTQCVGILPQEKGKDIFSEILQSQKPGYTEDKKIIEFWAPVLVESHTTDAEDLFFDDSKSAPAPEKTVIGFVGLTMDKTILEAGIRSIIKTNILTLLTSLIFGAFITYYIVRSVHKPLVQLANKVKKVHSHDSEPHDEVGMLSTTFDSLLKDMDSNVTTIERLQWNLEEKIKELKLEIISHVQTEAALQASEEKHRTLVETIRDIVYTLDLEARFTYVSPVAEPLLGYKPEELLGTHFINLMSPKDRQLAMDKFTEGIANKTPASLEGKFIKKDGTHLYLEVNGAPLFDADGNIIGRIGVARDISRRKQAEKERQELEVKALSQAKLASLGEIATGMAHEINQPLSYIKVVYESTLNDMKLNQLDTEELKRDFKEALYQVSRITKIVNHLRTFGHNREQQFTEIDLRKVLRSTKTILKNKIRKAGVSIIENVAGDLPSINGISVNLEQIFINLMQNSLSALTGRGNGTISIAMKRNEDAVIIRFADNGPGIPTAVRDRIFEPFFTTKEVGQGTGLGLSIVFGIVKEHNGTIELQSEPDGGALFTITLPIENEPAE